MSSIDHDAMARRIVEVSGTLRGRRAVLMVAGLLALGALAWRVEFRPAKLWMGTKEVFWIFTFMLPPVSGGAIPDYVRGILETLSMAFLGTLFGFLGALPFGFIGARNIVGNPLIHFAVRRVLDFCRGIDNLVWGLICVHAVGLGPFAGVLALAISHTFVLGKLFAEAAEGVERTQIHGTRATGANAIQVMRYGFMPQILPIYLSNALYFFESNVRSATVLGVVGAGGIGVALHDRLRIMAWDQVAFIVILILAMVAVTDTVSRILREKLTGVKLYRP
jgi:phosphonate transport system permease protein